MAKEGEHSGAKEVKLTKPKISLSDLTFVIYVTTVKKTSSSCNLYTENEFKKLGAELECGSNDRFHIQVENMSHRGISKSSMAGVGIKCEVIYKDDWEDGGFIIFDAQRPVDTNFGWLNNNLLTPKSIYRGLIAEIELSFNSELLDKIDLQIFHRGEGRYFSLDDTLSYLQCFYLY
ncbi:hypothetical protein ISN45_Aa06g003070 [Arabidopsis thaliana x Arabidopsis arenosa]|uniref:Uncharacterized protein n=1 Tax=Arabidopsis thaliana x Arabidopsis arenosa TaxID=1240361 RepID=A0A8T1YSH1_9BRAS|nr:hypothetical protein ISN45_Aa06g003070 [Arabidopsis thaliana x Arabidopsis arenosa]